MNVIGSIASKIIIPIKFGLIDISITNQVLLLWAAVALVFLFFYNAKKDIRLVPKRAQNFAELYISTLWEYLEPQIKDKAWLPFFCGLFSLILFCNLLGLLPDTVPPTANINFTATLAMIVFFTAHIAGAKKYGLKYLSIFAPQGIPLPIQIFILPVEIVSQLARPFSLAIRLFANIFAGHAVTFTIIGLIFIFKSYWVIPGSLFGHILITLFEILIAFIQAFVFTFLSAFYIGEALNLECEKEGSK